MVNCEAVNPYLGFVKFFVDGGIYDISNCRFEINDISEFNLDVKDRYGAIVFIRDISISDSRSESRITNNEVIEGERIQKRWIDIFEPDICYFKIPVMVNCKFEKTTHCNEVDMVVDCTFIECQNILKYVRRPTKEKES